MRSFRESFIIFLVLRYSASSARSSIAVQDRGQGGRSLPPQVADIWENPLRFWQGSPVLYIYQLKVFCDIK